MSRTEDVPETAHRVIVGTILLYFALFVYGATTGTSVAPATDALFGLIAFGVGGVLYLQSGGEPSATLAGAACFAVGGLAQFGALLTGAPSLEALTTLAVFAGIGLYLYVVWVEEQ